MRTTIKLLVIFLLNFILVRPNAQTYYYSAGKKVLLQRDTAAVFINFDKSTIKQSFLDNLLKVKGVQSVDKTSYDDVMVVKSSTSFNKNKIFSVLNTDKSVLHAWEALNLNGLPFLATGEILLKPKNGLTIDNVLNTLNLKNQVSISSRKYYDISVLNVADSSAIFNIANLIYESRLVDWCHPNFYVPIIKHTNDPLWDQQDYLKNTAQNGGAAGIDINVERAWNITRGSTNIRVAVIDDGVEDHEDLTGRVLNGFTPMSAIGNGRPTTSGAHGEAVAGIIGATQNNSLGITGVAPSCQVVPVNIFFGGETTLEIASAINWAWNQGNADILNNSWGYNTSSQTFPGFDAIIQSIINARTQGRNGLGSAVVFAAGNSGNVDVAFPANVDGVITVGSCNNALPAGDLWYYSQRGPSMDLVALSSDFYLVTLDRMGTAGYETGNYTIGFGGTSAASPQVAGVAALMLSVNNTLTETQVRTILQNTATDMGPSGFDNSFGFGRVDACAAVGAVLQLSIACNDYLCTTSTTYSIPNLPTGLTVQWSTTPTGIVTVNSPNSPQTTVTRNSCGPVTLIAAISNGCITLTKEVSTQTPQLTGIINSYQILAQFNNLTGPSYTSVSYNWPEVSNITATVLGSNPNTTINSYPGYFTFNLASGGLAVRLTGTHMCNGPVYKDVYFNRSYGYRIAASPNPAKGQINVNIAQVENNNIEKTPSTFATLRNNSLGTTRIYLHDLNTNAVIKQWTYQETKALNYNLNIIGVKPGYYVLKMERNNEITSTKILIQ